MTTPETPAAPPAASYTPVVTDIMRVVRVMFSPTGVFEEQREKPTWVLPWLIISVILVAIGLVMAPYQRHAMELAVQARGGPAPPESALMIGRVFAIVGVPIFLLLAGLISAFMMWVVLLATGGQVRFKGLFSVAIFASVVAVVQAILTSVALRMRGGPETVTSLADMRVSLGLDLLLSSESTISGFLRGLLGGIGPISIWGLAITAIGVATLEKQPKGAAWTAATVAFVVMLVVAALLQGMSGA
jgi:hypothetical protein